MFDRFPEEVVIDVLFCDVLSCAEVGHTEGICRRLNDIVHADELWPHLARCWGIESHGASLQTVLTERRANDETGTWDTIHTWRQLVLLHRQLWPQMGRDLNGQPRLIPFPTVHYVIPPTNLPDALDCKLEDMNEVPNLYLLDIWTEHTLWTSDLASGQRLWSFETPQVPDSRADFHDVQVQGNYIAAAVSPQGLLNRPTHRRDNHAFRCVLGASNSDGQDIQSTSSCINDIGLPTQPKTGQDLGILNVCTGQYKALGYSPWMNLVIDGGTLRSLNPA